MRMASVACAVQVMELGAATEWTMCAHGGTLAKVDAKCEDWRRDERASLTAATRCLSRKRILVSAKDGAKSHNGFADGGDARLVGNRRRLGVLGRAQRGASAEAVVESGWMDELIPGLRDDAKFGIVLQGGRLTRDPSSVLPRFLAASGHLQRC